MTTSTDDERSAPESDHLHRPGPGLRAVAALLHRVETLFYLVVAVLLLIAGVVVIVGTVVDLVESLRAEEALLTVALSLVEEALLLVIVGELLFTLQLVLSGRQLSGEPFLLIGLVATVRRVVVVTAEVESFPSGGRELTNFLLELGLLGLLTVAFAAAFFLLRRSRGDDVL